MKSGKPAALRRASCVLLGLSVCFGWGCGSGEQTGEVAFLLVSAGPNRSGMNLRDILDRTMVAEATCQVFIPGGRMIHQTFPVEATSLEPQEGRLADIPADSGYFARILGLTAERTVYQCGVNGPFDLEPGEKEFVTILIDRPPSGDQFCEKVCASDQDCPSGFVCPSPCAGGDFSQPCTPALCHPG